MRLETTIPPRTDGTVIARFGEDVYRFTSDNNGTLACEVGNPEHVTFLLNTGNFYPASEADYAAATALLKQDEDMEEPADVYDDDDDDVDPNAAPIESETPPAPRRGRRKKAE